MPDDALADAAAEEFTTRLKGELRGVNPRVVIGMEEVGYVDSVALEGLLDMADELSGRGAQLKLAGVTPTVREILEITGLSGRFQFFDGVDTAVRSFL